jgi:maltooligosyltrehalose trehalohydrolase
MAQPYPWEHRLGATVLEDGRVEFRVWAPGADRVAVHVGGADHELEDEGFGVCRARVRATRGDDYWIVLDDRRLPDPASRWQPRGLRGPSRVLHPAAFEWSDRRFRPAALREAVLYELHVGTFTPEGTFEAAAQHVPALAELGVTHIELMPVAEFPGDHGWGYDGVYVSAAHSAYGGPHGLQRFVDAAHAAGVGVILDVVYNHVGASGVKALEAFGPYFTERYETPWGPAVNFDGERSDPVREWMVQSAEGWVRDFHVDGLRLDAIHAIHDEGANHVLRELAERVHSARRGALVIAESGMNDPKVIRPSRQGGYGHDAAWADDFHHALHALLTGERAGWYEEFGTIAQLAKAFHRPHVHDGGYSTFRRRRFGAPADDVAPERFVVFSANHDQVGNRAFGDRLPVEVRPLAAFLTLLSPFTPMLFQGEEIGERAPFQFFSDHIDDEIAVATREGRRREFAAFASFGEEVPDPQDPATFAASKLTGEGDPPGLRDLYAALLRARRELPAGEAGAIDFDEHAGWLRVRRDGHAVLANFSRAPVHVPVEGPVEAVLATHHATIEPGYVVLPPQSGVLVKKPSDSARVKREPASSFGALP